MKVLRTILIVLIPVAVIAFVLYLLRPGAQGPGTAKLPLDLQKIIPASWTAVPDKYKPCDFDGDGEDEYLVIYRYDPPAPASGLPPSTPTPQVIADRSLIGGAIFDTQVNRAPQSPGTPAPYRPAFLVPYKLLPDIYGSKGQGYLGQKDVKIIYLPGNINEKCTGTEIVAYGYGQDSLPTILSLFRWAGESKGYVNVNAYFQADTRLQAYGPNRSLDAMPGAIPQKPVMDVYTYNQLNLRSQICSVRHYARTSALGSDGLPLELDFAEPVNDATIDFCYGPPKDPAYPEGVVVALLRGQNPNEKDTPTGASYLMSDATIPAEINELKNPQRAPFRILSMDVPGSLGKYPPEGIGWNPTGTPPATPPSWWKSSDEAPVDAEIVLGNQPAMQVRFTLVSIANEKANTDLRWRITRIELR